ncbi:MAG: ABC transporter ATP-binding protein [Candidatus Saccharicenans sp.]|nr:ABC transporter ATP-binding protein [Candidatus Saccharicenans sp.]MDI6848404.1 ABC transporter ATP-binding protein [Candidatus Saccharicenans sp.]
MKFLSVEKLEAGYSELPVISDISLEIEPGEFLAVCGPNGSGKSTLVRAVQKLTPFVRGKVILNNRSLFELKPRQVASLLAYVPQVFEPVFAFSVEETVAMARYYRQPGRLAGFTERDRAAVEEAMRLTDVSSLREKKLNELSGGERQRVLIARALAQDTPALLMDEPSSHLDLNFQLQVYWLLKELQKKRGKAILVAEHNLNLAAAYCSNLIFIKNGKIFARGRPEELLEKEIIRQIFGVEVEVRTNRSTGLPEISLVHPGSEPGIFPKATVPGPGVESR